MVQAREYQEQGRVFLKKEAELIGEDDELFALLAYLVNLSERNCAVINSMVERGKALEEW